MDYEIWFPSAKLCVPLRSLRLNRMNRRERGDTQRFAEVNCIS